MHRLKQWRSYCLLLAFVYNFEPEDRGEAMKDIEEVANDGR